MNSDINVSNNVVINNGQNRNGDRNHPVGAGAGEPHPGHHLRQPHLR